MTFWFVLLFRLYGVGCMILLLNAVSGLVFNPTNKQLTQTFKSLGLVLVWPLALFSPAGRKIMFNVKL